MTPSATRAASDRRSRGRRRRVGRTPRARVPSARAHRALRAALGTHRRGRRRSRRSAHATGKRAVLSRAREGVGVVNSPEYRELPPKQIVPRLADEGRYVASESTVYRILRAEGQDAHRGGHEVATAVARRRRSPKGTAVPTCADPRPTVAHDARSVTFSRAPLRRRGALEILLSRASESSRGEAARSMRRAYALAECRGGAANVRLRRSKWRGGRRKRGLAKTTLDASNAKSRVGSTKSRRGVADVGLPNVEFRAALTKFRCGAAKSRAAVTKFRCGVAKFSVGLTKFVSPQRDLGAPQRDSADAHRKFANISPTFADNSRKFGDVSRDLAAAHRNFVRAQRELGTSRSESRSSTCNWRSATTEPSRFVSGSSSFSSKSSSATVESASSTSQ